MATHDDIARALMTGSQRTGETPYIQPYGMGPNQQQPMPMQQRADVGVGGPYQQGGAVMNEPSTPFFPPAAGNAQQAQQIPSPQDHQQVQGMMQDWQGRNKSPLPQAGQPYQPPKW